MPCRTTLSSDTSLYRITGIAVYLYSCPRKGHVNAAALGVRLRNPAPGQGNHRRLLAGRTMREISAAAAGLALCNFGRAVLRETLDQLVREAVTATPKFA